MNDGPSRWRRLAVKLAQHASWVLPGSRSPWAEAMRRELDYIGDDPAAVRWALGCVLASYRARLAHRPSVSTRTAWHVAASGVMLLVIGLALQDNAAEGQTQPPPPAFDEATCDLANLAPELRHNGTASVPRKSNDRAADRFRSDCADPASAKIPDTARGR